MLSYVMKALHYAQWNINTEILLSLLSCQRDLVVQRTDILQSHRTIMYIKKAGRRRGTKFTDVTFIATFYIYLVR
jgi:hypothetical protein